MDNLAVYTVESEKIWQLIKIWQACLKAGTNFGDGLDSGQLCQSYTDKPINYIKSLKRPRKGSLSAIINMDTYLESIE